MGPASSPAPGTASLTMSRGLAILQVLAESPTPLTTAQLADTLNLERTAAYRLVQTLVSRGLVARHRNSGRLASGLGLLALGRSPHRDLRAAALPHLPALTAATSATAYLGIREDGDVVCLASTEPVDPMVTIRFREGARHPLTQGASGLVLRALDRAETDPAVVATRSRGYASSTLVVEPDTSAIAVPLPLGPSGPGACLTLIFSVHHEPDRDQTLALLHAAAATISLHVRAAHSTESPQKGT